MAKKDSQLDPVASVLGTDLVAVTTDPGGTPATNRIAIDAFLAGRTLAAIASFGIRSSGAAFDLRIANSEVLTANRTLNISVNNAARNLSLAGDFTVSNNITLASDGTGTRTLNIGAGGTLGSNAFNSTAFLTANQTITLSGDISGSGTTSITTAIGTTKVTSAMLNADVFSTAHSWGGQQTFTAPVLGTPASGVATNLTGLPPTTGIVGWPANASGVLTNNGSGTLSWETVGGGAAWGAITGTLADQTDLVTALGLKANLSSPTFTTNITTPVVTNTGAISITTTASNGDINLTPNGSGNVVSTRSFNTSVGGQAYIAGTSNSDYKMGIVGGGTAALRIHSAGIIAWSDDTNANNTLDTHLSRNAGGVLQVGTNAANASGSLILTNLTTTATSSTGTAAIIDGSNVLRPLTSSLRFKRNVREWHPSADVMSAFLSLNPIRWDHKDNGVKNVVGFSAEGLAGISADLVNFDKDGLPYSNREHAILVVMHEILRKQQAEISELKAKFH